MKTVIEKYKKFIWIWLIVHSFALFVNLFSLDMNFQFEDSQTETALKDKIGKDEKFHFTVYFFTNKNNSNSQFWPFVTYIGDDGPHYISVWDGTKSNRYADGYFNGIFHNYDISEFLFYLALIVIFLSYKAYIVKPEIKEN